MSAQQIVAPMIDLAKSVENSSTSAIASGITFAAAVAWMDAVRFMISKMINVKKNGGEYYVLTALATSILAAVVVMVLKKYQKNLKTSEVVYAISN